MIILVVLVASALVGLAIGVVFFSALAIVLASPFIAFVSAALLVFYGYGLGRVVLVSAASLAALQSFYLVGAVMRYLTSDDEQDRALVTKGPLQRAESTRANSGCSDVQFGRAPQRRSSKARLDLAKQRHE
jgi:hypothetical protein